MVDAVSFQTNACETEVKPEDSFFRLIGEISAMNNFDNGWFNGAMLVTITVRDVFGCA
jgi:hypothetical protein